MKNRITYLVNFILFMTMVSFATAQTDDTPSIKGYKIGGEFERNEFTYKNELDAYLTPFFNTVGNIEGVIVIVSKNEKDISTVFFQSGLLPSEKAYLVEKFIDAVNIKYSTNFNAEVITHSMKNDEKLSQYYEFEKAPYTYLISISFVEEDELYELQFIIGYNDAVEDF